MRLLSLVGVLAALFWSRPASAYPWMIRHEYQGCVPCHAAVPTQPGFAAPPNGLSFDALDAVRAHLPEVRQQLATHAMPLGNLTGMSEEERAVVLQWASHETQSAGERR